MFDSFELEDVAEAEAFCRRCNAASRLRGLYLLHTGEVGELTPVIEGVEYRAVVGGNRQPCLVSLRYDERQGWKSHCSRHTELRCEHAYAMMSALLAAHRDAEVQSLSAGRFRRAAAARRTPAPAEQPDDLRSRLEAARGEALTGAEEAYLRRIETLYERCRVFNQALHDADWQLLGLPISRYAGEELWPSFPTSAFQFWQYLAYAAHRRGGSIPEFMKPVTHLERTGAEILKWQKRREIDRWSKVFNEINATDAETPREEAVKLRLVLHPHKIQCETQAFPQSPWRPLKLAQARQLADEISMGRPRLTAESFWLWQLLGSEGGRFIRVEMPYEDDDALRLLNQALRADALREAAVMPDGGLVPRMEEPLRWEILEPAGEEEYYRLRLVQSDGRPLEGLLLVLPGAPTLYLTVKGLYQGPPKPDTMLETDRENRIPAAAIERTAGLMFLQRLGLEAPARVRDRIQTVKYAVKVRAEIVPGPNRREDCRVTVTASAPGRSELTWRDNLWQNPRTGKFLDDSGSDLVILDTSLMRQVPRLLEPLGLKSSYLGHLVTRITKAFPGIFADWLKTIPPEIQTDLVGDLKSLANGEVSGSIKLDVREAGVDWFDLSVVLNISDLTLTPAEIKLLLNARGNYVRLEGKGWRRLRFDLTEEQDQRLARLGISPKELSSEPQRLHALQLADEAAREFLAAEQFEGVRRRAAELKARVTPAVPAGIAAQLRPYQIEGFHFLAYLSTNGFGGILADDMGLGKTLQTLAWLLWLRAQPGEHHPSLVVCPKSVMDNWRAETDRFTPGIRVRVWPAAELEELPGQLASADLHVINYSQLRAMGSRLREVSWEAAILDEGQYIKNPSSQTAEVARSLRARHRLILSGTPIENRLLDLWSLMSFSMPGVLGPRAQFGRIYDAQADPLARRRLSSRVRPFVLRRIKAHVAKDLPDRIEEDLLCEMEGGQQALYRAELKRAQQMLLGMKTQKEVSRNQFNFLTSLLRLRQICCHPALLAPDSKAASAKVEALLEQLEPLVGKGEKVLVFSQFVQMLELIRPALEERGWPVHYLTGASENRGEIVSAFQRAEESGVFLISLKAGGFGLNLTAASYVFLFDPWWNPAVENQAIDRTHRIGQANKVIAYRLLIKNSVEEKIRALQKSKKVLAEDVMGEEKFAQSLTVEDLKYLFSE